MGQRQFEREVLGAPLVPPSRVTAAADGMRRLLRRAHRRAAPPPLQILDALFAQFDAPVLRVIVDLDLPAILERPRTLDELVARTGSDRDRLERVLRYATARGFVGRDTKGRFRANGVTKALRNDAAAPWAGWVRFATSKPFVDAWRNLPAGLAAGTPVPFEAANGADFFHYHTKVEPEAGAAFDQAMQSGATLQAIGLARSLEWKDVKSVCDVGGGTGVALEVLQRYHAHLDVTLFDLPEVVARARFQPAAGSPGSRQIVGGSFFEQVPPGFDRYTLLAIIHDWDDEHARAILTKVREAMTPNSRAIVVETVAASKPRDDFANASDLMMLVLATGRERTLEQYGSLFASAGLTITRRRTLPTGATAFTLSR